MPYQQHELRIAVLAEFDGKVHRIGTLTTCMTVNQESWRQIGMPDDLAEHFSRRLREANDDFVVGEREVVRESCEGDPDPWKLLIERLP